MENKLVKHPNLGYGVVFDDIGAMTLVKFYSGELKSVQTRLLKIVSEKEYKENTSEKEYKEDKEIVSENEQNTSEKEYESVAKKNRNIRNQEIVLKLKNGYGYRKIARMFSLSPSTVTKIAKVNGIDIMKDKKLKTLEIIEKIKQDINNGVSYSEIKNTYKINTKLSQAMRLRGFLVFTNFKTERDKDITNKYTNGTIARKLTSKQLKQIQSVGGIYGVVSGENKVYRYPKIKRGYSGLFENKEVIKIITKMKKRNKTNSEIAEKLNELGYTTPYGLKYEWHHIQHRVTKIKLKKHKVKKLDL